MNTSTGQAYNARWTVQQRPDVVLQQITGAAATADGYSFQQTGPTSVVLTRKYWPVWLLVVVIVGTLLCLIGLLGLLYKQTETLTVSATEEGDVTRVDIAGTASTELLGRLNGVLAAMPGAQQAMAPAVAMPTMPAPAVAQPAAAATVPPPPPPDANAATPTVAGWNPDPRGRHEYRYWDGNAWTDNVSDGGQQSTDPVG
jgi:hypothetical protein